MTRLQKILLGAYRDLVEWRGTPRLVAPGDRRHITRHNKRCDDAVQGIVPCDVSRWLGERQSPGNRVSNCRIYKELACRDLAHPVAEGRRRQRTVGLALTDSGEQLARELSAQAIAAPSGAMLTPPEAAPVTSPTPISTTEDFDLSRQSECSRRMEGEAAKRVTPPPAVLTPMEPAVVASPTPETPAPRGYVSVFNGELN